MLKKRKGPSFCKCALAFALGTLLAFIVPVWLIAVMEAIIVLVFGWMLFFG